MTLWLCASYVPGPGTLSSFIDLRAEWELDHEGPDCIIGSSYAPGPGVSELSFRSSLSPKVKAGEVSLL